MMPPAVRSRRIYAGESAVCGRKLGGSFTPFMRSGTAMNPRTAETRKIAWKTPKVCPPMAQCQSANSFAMNPAANAPRPLPMKAAVSETAMYIAR